MAGVAGAAARRAEEAARHLAEADPRLAPVVARVGPIAAEPEPDLWRCVAESIVSQQLSVRAADTISGRLAALGEEAGSFPSPQRLLGIAPGELRGCGLSGAKTTYLRDLAERWTDGSLRAEEIPALDDAEVIARLTAVKGVGVWTAHMVLIFGLARPDVLPVGDLGVREASARLYGLPERPGPAELERLAEPWRPFRSYGARYLWRSLSLPAEAA
jgi:DNA-3-methyladenine glycosylase II